MRHLVAALVFSWLGQVAVVAVAPIPEPEQGPLALKMIKAYLQSQPRKDPRKLYVVYFTPSDREPEPRYGERLEPVLEDIRAFYRIGMQKAGFGPMTFPLEKDFKGRTKFHLVKSASPEAAFPRPISERMSGDGLAGSRIINECRPVLKEDGITFDQETVLIFCNLASWDEKTLTFHHHSPYSGWSTQTRGWCFALDTVILDVADLPKKEPILHDREWGNESLGKFNTIFIGGIAHELGHAFGLPHCGERWDEKLRGTSLMGAGNHTYREEMHAEGKGAFLTMASAMRLAGRPLFNGSSVVDDKPLELEEPNLSLSTNIMSSALSGRRGTLHLEGRAVGSPPIYGIVAYFDSAHDGGYQAPTATSVPDAQGRFALEISDLAPSENCQVRLEFCHVNGRLSERNLTIGVGTKGTVDLSRWEVMAPLERLAAAVAHEQPAAAEAELKKLNQANVPQSTKAIARALVASLHEDARSSPADAPPDLNTLPLGDAKPESAEVGWLKPAANRIPANPQIESPLLDSGRIYATGLYAHSPARYVFALGGKWKTLRGEAGLHTAHQSYAAGVVLVIKTDGKEIFRSADIRGENKASYEVNVSGVKSLELIVEKADDANNNNWALWLEPTLLRESSKDAHPSSQASKASQ